MINCFKSYSYNKSIFAEMTTFIKEKIEHLKTKITGVANDIFPTKADPQIQILTEIFEKHRKKAANIPAAPSNTYLQQSSNLEFNLKLAHEILKDTHKAVLFSANNIHRNRKRLDKRAQKKGIVLEDLSSITKEAWKILQFSWQETRREYQGSWFNRGKFMYKNACKFFVGNCQDMAIVGLFKGLDKGVWNIPLDQVHINWGDHAFLVIGREKGSDPKDYKTWGSNAVVMDAWANKVYKLSELENNLDDYTGYDEETGEPHLRKFDPNTQRIEITFGNICSTQDLLKAQINNEIQQVLEEFHQAETLQTKIASAKSLQEKISNSQIKHLNVIAMLNEQINYFIELNRN